MMYWKYLFVLVLLTKKVYLIQDYRQLVDYDRWFESKGIVKEYTQKSSLNDEICDQDLMLFKQSLERSESWAIKFADTWAKVDAGYLSGNTINIGDFDSCVKFEHYTESNKILKGQYCLVGLSALPNSTLETDRNDISLKHL